MMEVLLKHKLTSQRMKMFIVLDNDEVSISKVVVGSGSDVVAGPKEEVEVADAESHGNVEDETVHSAQKALRSRLKLMC